MFSGPIDCNSAQAYQRRDEENLHFFQLPNEIQEMIFTATNIMNWFEVGLGNMCLVHPSWAHQIPYIILDRGENRDEIVGSLLYKAENNLDKIVRIDRIEAVAYRIRNLVLHGFNRFTDDQLYKVFDTFCNLEVVTIGLSGQLTAKGVVKALKKAKQLKALTLRCQMTDQELADIAGHFPCLTGVDLTLCRGVTDSGVADFLSGCNTLADFCFPRKISMETVFNLLKSESYPNLTSLDLTRIDKFDAHLFESIRNKFPQLAFVSLPKDQSLTLEGVNALLDCPIQHIKISGSTITDACLEPIIIKAKYLQSLHLSNCPSLTDRTLDALAKYRPPLKHLVTSGQMSNQGLFTIAETCNAIEGLDVAESQIVIDVNLLKDLTEKLPYLKELRARAKDVEHLGTRMKNLRIKGEWILNDINTFASLSPSEIFV